MGLDQPVAVVGFRFQKIADTRRANPQEWADILNTQVNSFYLSATYGLTSFRFEVPAGLDPDGWIDMPWEHGTEFFGVSDVAEVLAVADAQGADLTGFDRVLVIGNSPTFFGQAPTYFVPYQVSLGVETTINEDGIEKRVRFMHPSIVWEWDGGVDANTYDPVTHVVAHELGHGLGLKTHYGSDVWLDYTTSKAADLGIFSVMAANDRQPPSHFLGWSKKDRSWLPANRVVRLIEPNVGDRPTTVLLAPLEETPAAANVAQLIELPTLGGPEARWRGFTIEYRDLALSNHGSALSGVLLTDIEAGSGRDSSVAQILDARPTRRLFENGDVFEDPANGIRVEVGEFAGGLQRVHIVRSHVARPVDLAIAPWDDTYQTPDIWIDSPANQFGVFKYADSWGYPVGNGDDPWLDHTNRIQFRVHNRGDFAAANVEVDVHVSRPPTAGGKKSFAYQGTVRLSSIGARSAAIGSVNWIPTDGTHTCVLAEIKRHSDGDVDTNNSAQENIVSFDVTQSSPWSVAKTLVDVAYDAPKAQRILVQVEDLPEGWGYEIDQTVLDLDPGENRQVTVAVHPAGLDDQEDRYRVGFVGRPKITTWVEWEDTVRPLGGVHLQVRLVDQTSTELGIEPAGEAVIAVGAVATHDGSLAPHLRGAPVAISVLAERADEPVVIASRLDQNGAFAELLPLSAGKYAIHAHFPGVGVLSASTSDPLALEVDEESARVARRAHEGGEE